MKAIAANLISVIGGEALLRIANFCAVVVIARVHGASALGIYATALAYISVAAMIAENGLCVTAVSEISRRPHHSDSALSELFVVKSLLFAPVLLALFVGGTVVHLSRFAWVVAALLMIRAVLQSFSQLHLAVLKATDRMQTIGPVQAAHFLVLVLGLAFVSYVGLSLRFLVTWLVMGQALELLLSGYLIWGAGIRPGPVSGRSCLALLKRSTPIGFSYGLSSVMLRMDVIILSTMVPVVVVGRFAAAQTFVTAVYLVSWLFGSVLLPEFVRRSGSLDLMEGYVLRWRKLILALTIPGALTGFLLASPLIRSVYGAGFAESGRLTAVMTLAVPFILLNSLSLHKAIALSQSSQYVSTYLITTVVGAAADLLFIRWVGAIGISCSLIVRELSIFFLFKLFVARQSNRLAQRQQLDDTPIA